MTFTDHNQKRSTAGHGRSSAFTLLELLVVIGIIAILAGAALPAFRGFGESNILQSAQRQLLDALSFARLKAINERTTVYVLFAPPGQGDPSLVRREGKGFAVYAARSVGDQPGQSTARFLTGWESLPDGMIICPQMFGPASGAMAGISPELRPLPRTSPAVNAVQYFYYPPTGDGTPVVNPNISFAYIAFDSRGKLVRPANYPEQDQYLCFQRGAVLYAEDKDTGLGQVNPPAELIPEPNSPLNYIRINWLTGRAELVEAPAP